METAPFVMEIRKVFYFSTARIGFEIDWNGTKCECKDFRIPLLKSKFLQWR